MASGGPGSGALRSGVTEGFGVWSRGGSQTGAARSRGMNHVHDPGSGSTRVQEVESDVRGGWAKGEGV